MPPAVGDDRARAEAAQAALSTDVPPASEAPGESRPVATALPSARPLVQPLAADRYHVSFTAGASLRDKLQLAQDLLRHAVPDGDPAAIVERALDALIEMKVKEKYAATPAPRPGFPRPGRDGSDESRHVPAEVKRAVFVRDGGRCAYVGPHGRRCGERSFVEFHHVSPYAAGGRATADNIALRCRAHNQYESEVFFGPARRHLPWAVGRAVSSGAPQWPRPPCRA